MIQKIKRDEIPECVKVIKTSFMTVAEELGFTPENAPRFTPYATTDDRLFWQFDNEKRLMYAYYQEGKIVGYYSLLMQENNECELNNISVLPEYRHQEIGAKLLLHLFEMAKALGCTKMNIGIVEENKRLRKWYENG